MMTLRSSALAVGFLGLLTGLCPERLQAANDRFVSSDDGGALAVIGDDGAVKLVRTQDGTSNAVSLGAAINVAAFSHDAGMFAACLNNGSLVFVDGSGVVKTLDAAARCSELSWSKDDSKLYYLSVGASPGRDPDEVLELKMATLKTGERRSVHTTRRRFPFAPPVIPPSMSSRPAVPPASAPPPPLKAPPAPKLPELKAPPPADVPPPAKREEQKNNPMTAPAPGAEKAPVVAPAEQKP